MSRGKLSTLFFLIALITYPVVTEGNLNFFRVMFSIIACVCPIFSLMWSMRISKFSDSHVSRSSSKRHIVIREVLSRCGTGIVWALWLDTLLLSNVPYADAVFMLACLYFCLTGVLPFFEPNLVPSDLLVIYSESIVLLVVLLVLGGVPVLYAAMLPVSSCLGIVTCSLKTGLWSVRRRDKLITAKEREKILGTLVHEIRTPLTVMQAAENILLEEIPGPLTGKQKHFLQVIYANTQRLVLFSENMLSLLKMGKDWTPDLSCTIDVQKLVMDVIELVGPLLQSRRQEVRTSFPALLSRPYADPSWIQQVLLNLIHNASKYTDDGGYIIRMRSILLLPSAITVMGFRMESARFCSPIIIRTTQKMRVRMMDLVLVLVSAGLSYADMGEMYLFPVLLNMVPWYRFPYLRRPRHENSSHGC